MPSLVGIGNSQVPTNAMLGRLAYQDSVGEIDIKKIKARTSDTAVDIFVYDTRKDSDGGAWRKRATTQSWYNEGASKTRGARKEFPAVAIIVIETYEIVIYDGDDPNLSMWMRFEMNQLQSPAANMGRTPFGLGHTNAYPHNNLNLSCVHMLNGYLFIGANRAANSNQLTAGYDVNFVSEIMHEYLHYPGSASNATKWRLAGKLVDRNRTDLSDSPTSRYDSTGFSIQDMVNDVDMVVLPNAPIDQFSKLPVPTVALATEGGASIIMNDGNVYSTNDTLNWSRVNISEANGRKVLNYIFSIGGTVRHKFIDNISADFDRDYEDYPHTSASTSVASNGNSDVYGHSSGLMIYKRGNDPGSWNNADFDDSKARVTSSFNTGYMHGDIKGAFLSDTDTTNLSGGNKVSNGSDWSGASGSQSSTPPTGWTAGNGATFAVETGNGAVGNYIRLYNENNGGAGPNSYMYQAITTVVGKKYKYSGTQIHRATITVYLRIGTTAGGNQLGGSQFVSSSSNTPRQVFGEFTATGTTTYVSLGIISGTHNYGVGWDDIYVSEMDKDRSVNSNSLHAVGTISKAKVATGADLAYYGGFSNSNYFFQPYNSLLDFGTGDLCIMFWMKNTQNDAYDDLIHRRAHNGSAYTGTGWYLQMGNDQNITLKDSASNQSRAIVDADSVYNVWQHVCFVRRNGYGYAYKNGDPQSTNGDYAWTENLDNSSAILTIGRATNSGGGDADKTFLALVRIGADAPSEEQIKKIYNDEQHLFDENAKCTLHGTSDDVEALAYDDTNDTLHAGTSAGRSEFQGLSRINNTTTAVTTAISASNELVAEQ